jgi:hypothetical protein
MCIDEKQSPCSITAGVQNFTQNPVLQQIPYISPVDGHLLIVSAVTPKLVEAVQQLRMLARSCWAGTL